MYIKQTIRQYINESDNNIFSKIYTGRDFLALYNTKIKEINSFKYFCNSMDFNDFDNVYFFVLYNGENMVGLAHIRKSPYIDNTYWLSYLSILPKHENKGYASMLSNYIFKWYSDNGIQFETSSYSEQGLIKLKPLFNRLANKYNVSFIDKERL